jgi:hypothetical protein
MSSIHTPTPFRRVINNNPVALDYDMAGPAKGI